MTGKSIDYLWSFIVGGILSVLAQVVFMFLLATGISFAYSITFMLAIMATVGFILTITERYQKLEGLSGFGAMLPLSGFSAAMAEFSAAALKDGKSFKEVVAEGLNCAFVIFGIGMPFALVAALIVFHLG